MGIDTFDIDPEFPVQVTRRRASVFSTKEEGLALRRQTNKSKSRNSGRAEWRLWTLNWNRATHGQVERAQALHASSLYGARLLDYTPTDGDGASPSALEVRMVSAVHEESQDSAEHFRMRVELEEFV